MASQKITLASVTHLPVWHRKEVGKVAFADNIGLCRSEWLVRVHTESGLQGLTIANRYMRSPNGSVAGLLDILKEAFLGRTLDELLTLDGDRVTGVGKTVSAVFRDHPWLSIAAFDLVGRARCVSCIDMLGGGRRNPVPAYDTTMFYQDFLDPEKGSAKNAEEAAASRADGYWRMKIKIGRGSKWMLPEDGLQRDIEVIQAIREAVGPEHLLMVDGNFGYNGRFDLLEDLMRETASANIFWFEEMITADVNGYRRMRDIQMRHAPNALLVCGEVDQSPVSPVYQDLAAEGLMDAYQADIGQEGFANWMEIERTLEGTGTRSNPRNFGNGRFGTRAGVIFGASSETYIHFEDERQLDHTYKPDGLSFENGAYVIGNFHGLGLEIDLDIWDRDHAKHEVQISA